MEKLSSEEGFRHRFDRLCQIALKGEAINYYTSLQVLRFPKSG